MWGMRKELALKELSETADILGLSHKVSLQSLQSGAKNKKTSKVRKVQRTGADWNAMITQITTHYNRGEHLRMHNLSNPEANDSPQLATPTTQKRSLDGPESDGSGGWLQSGNPWR